MLRNIGIAEDMLERNLHKLTNLMNRAGLVPFGAKKHKATDNFQLVIDQCRLSASHFFRFFRYGWIQCFMDPVSQRIIAGKARVFGEFNRRNRIRAMSQQQAEAELFGVIGKMMMRDGLCGF